MDIVRGDPLAKQNERVEEAVKAKAKCVGDAEFNKTMANFYTERVMNINPWDDHVGFCNARTSQLEYQELHAASEKLVEEATAKADAHAARYLSLQHQHSAASTGVAS